MYEYGVYNSFQIGLSKKPPVNVNGAYCKPIVIREPSSRDKLVFDLNIS